MGYPEHLWMGTESFNGWFSPQYEEETLQHQMGCSILPVIFTRLFRVPVSTDGLIKVAFKHETRVYLCI